MSCDNRPRAFTTHTGEPSDRSVTVTWGDTVDAGPDAQDPGPGAGVLTHAERVGFEPTDELPRHLLSREARSTRLRHLSVLRRRSYTADGRGPAYDAERSGGRADECTGLENRRLERVRGFESLPLRHVMSRYIPDTLNPQFGVSCGFGVPMGW
jgi:hypothetical protein